MLKNDECGSVITIAGLRGGSGKTFVSLGLASTLVQQGKNVCPFKKGPDYIDAGWLSFAAGRHCYNLDTFMCSKEIVKESFLYHSAGSDIALIEGNRGLYDAIDVEGSTSTAEIAKLVDSPVIVCIDCTKCTMTIGAIVLGLEMFDSDLNLAGVVLNRVAGARHAGKLRRAVEHHTNAKVIGAIPRIKKIEFPERHMGLVPTCENEDADKIVKEAGRVIKDNLNVDLILDIAKKDKPFKKERSPYEIILPKKEDSPDLKIGVIMDEAFQFYYPENLLILENYGAKLVKISAVKDDKLPDDLDALYIGGGFPESFARELSNNSTMRESVKEAALNNLPIYAECGGLIYLGESIVLKDEKFEMCGFFPLSFGISKKPQGHGYVDAIVTKENPFIEKGSHLQGHEFRYSTIIEMKLDKDIKFSYDLDRGVGITGNQDAITKKNTLASYLHLHSFGSLTWASGLLKAAKKYNLEKNR